MSSLEERWSARVELEGKARASLWERGEGIVGGRMRRWAARKGSAAFEYIGGKHAGCLLAGAGAGARCI